MVDVTPLQNDFTVGEVSPDVVMRSTLEARQRGLDTLRNFLPDSRGPVVRRNGFRFLGRVGVARPGYTLPCPLTVTVIDDSTFVGIEGVDWMDYDATRNLVYYTNEYSAGTTSSPGGLTVLDLSDDSLTNYPLTNSSRGGGLIGTDGADIRDAKLLLTDWLNPGIANRVLRQIDLATLTEDWDFDFGNDNFDILGQTRNRWWVYGYGGPGDFFRMTKSSGGRIFITSPVGYDSLGTGRKASAQLTVTRMMIGLQETSSGEVHLFELTEGATSFSASDKIGDHPADAIVGVNSWSEGPQAINVNGSIYLFWSANSGSNKKHISQIDATGSLVEDTQISDDADPDNPWPSVIRINHAESINSFVWMSSANATFLNRWSLETRETEFCDSETENDGPVAFDEAGNYYIHERNVAGSRAFYRLT